MEFLVPLAGLALLTIPAIVLLYFLKVRRPEVRVATLMFWRRHLADRQANAPWQRLRPSTLLFLQLAAALVLGAGLMRPGLIGAAGVDSTTVVMIDASPSMESTDVGPSRFGAAVERAKSLADQLAPGQQMAVILLGDHASLLAPPTGDASVLRAALDRARPSGGAGDFAEAVTLADSILAGRSGGSIIMLSDGHSRAPTSPPRVTAPFTYVSIGSTGENAGIQALSPAPGGAVFLRLANYGRATRDMKVEMRADGRLADVLPVKLEGNTTTDVTWSRLPTGTQVLEARLTPADALALDDSAWLVLAAPPHHAALLVTDENGFMQRALKLRPGLDVTTVKPADYKQGGKYDLYVFDGFVPPGRLPEPALLIDPPPGQGPAPQGAAIDPGAVLPGDPRDALLRDVTLKDVHVLSAGAIRPPSGWRTVISAATDPLLLVRDGDVRDAQLTFDLHHSDLPLRAAFPILVQNLLDYLLPGGFENQVFAPGDAVTLIAEPNARYADVTGPDGSGVRLTPPYPPFTGTDVPGVYTVRQQLATGVRLSRFVVQLQDQSMARIAPGAAPLIQAVDQPRGPLPRGTLEIWPWLVAGGLVLLVAEWFVYLRGR